jgi:hypothetical protein
MLNILMLQGLVAMRAKNNPAELPAGLVEVASRYFFSTFFSSGFRRVLGFLI